MTNDLILPVDKPDNTTMPDIDPALRLTDKRLEETAKHEAQGLSTAKSWQASSPVKIGANAGHQKALQLRHNVPYLARVQWIRQNQDKPKPADMPVERPQNALDTIPDMIEHLRVIARTGRDPDALRALKELIDHKQASELSRPDPSQLFSFIITAEMDGLKPCVEAAGGLKQLARVICRVCKVESVELTDAGQIERFTRGGHKSKPSVEEGDSIQDDEDE